MRAGLPSPRLSGCVALGKPLPYLLESPFLILRGRGQKETCTECLARVTGRAVRHISHLPGEGLQSQTLGSDFPWQDGGGLGTDGSPRRLCTGHGTVSSQPGQWAKGLGAAGWWRLFLILGTSLWPALSLGSTRSGVSGRLSSASSLPASCPDSAVCRRAHGILFSFSSSRSRGNIW